MEKILKFLSGKKTTIGAVIMLIILFCANRGYIAQDVSELIGSIMVVLGFVANVSTSKMYGKSR